MIDVTVVLTLHREGKLVEGTLISLSRCIKQAKRSGISVQTLIVLDRADEETTRMARCGLLREFELEFTDYGDPGLARNFGVQKAKGRLIAFLDGDDLWCRNWLTSAVQASKRDDRKIVWHPEKNLYFGNACYILEHVDMEGTIYTAESLAISNYWTALCIVDRDVLLEVPFRATDKSKQMGHEDWAWNMEVIGHGAIHKTVSGTAHAIRRKRQHSVVMDATTKNVSPASSEGFADYVIDFDGNT